jgi:hypothetical protein
MFGRSMPLLGEGTLGSTGFLGGISVDFVPSRV